MIELTAWHAFAQVTWILTTYDLLLFGLVLFGAGFLAGLKRGGD